MSCEICPYVTHNAWLLRSHMKIHQQREGANLKCSECNSWFKSAIEHTKHKYLHGIKGDDKVVCDECSKPYLKSARASHMATCKKRKEKAAQEEANRQKLLKEEPPKSMHCKFEI